MKATQRGSDPPPTLPAAPDDGAFVEQEAGSELFLYDSERDQVHVLNRTARRVRDLARRGRSPEEIEAAVRAEFRPPPGEDVAGQVLRCIETLKQKGIL